MAKGPVPTELEAVDRFRRAALRALSAAVLLSYRMLFRGRVRFGEGVITNHRLIIKGPGRVVVGDRANLFTFGTGKRTRLITRTSNATIRIGDNVRLNGPELHADTLIDIGPDCIVGQAHLIDTAMHSLAFDRRTNPAAPVPTAPVVLERNVWVARGAAILAGVRIGHDSVVGYGSVVTSDVPPCVLVAGNPARVIKELA
jgi:acetyltransferase-like isoleucine patch superfamily enzyme